jgi:cathepsin B
MSNGGCNGGYQYIFWDYVKNGGMVPEKCMPYTSGSSGQPYTCPAYCADGTTLSANLISVNSYYQLPSDINTIKADIVKNGPVQAFLTVYRDFYSYGGGIYSYVTGEQIGNHVVKLIGYGTDPATGKGYWIGANSWGTSWGEKGL